MNYDKFNLECTTDEINLFLRCIHYALFSPSFILDDSEKVALVDLYRKTFKALGHD